MRMRSTTPESPVSTLLTEDVITLAQARSELARITGRRPDKATIHRWVHRGVGGIRLEAIKLGIQTLTSRQALTRFVEARKLKAFGS